MNFASRLKELRIDKGLTQRELAKQINFSYSVVVKWECGSRQPNSDAVIAVAKFFKVTTDYLLGIAEW